MHTVESIHRSIMNAPTIMDLSVEESFCIQLVKLSPEEVAGNPELIADILDRLDESHSDSFYGVTTTDCFSEFITWARKLATTPSCFQLSGRLTGIADMFSILPQ